MVPILIAIIICIVLGLFFYNEKFLDILAGYNSMTPEEKNKYDKAKLASASSKFMFSCSFALFFQLLSIILKVEWLKIICFVLIIANLAFFLIWVNIGKCNRE